MNPKIRRAHHGDLIAMAACDPLASAGGSRRAWLEESLELAICLVTEGAEGMAGFLVLERRFFGHAFVSLLVVHPEARRRGHAIALLAAAEGLCRTDKLFTSTNVSNLAAQELFLRTGFQPSGTITNLDEGDDDLVFCKAVGQPKSDC